MNINKTLHDNHHSIYLAALSINQEDTEAYIAKCQALLDSGEAKPLFPWDNEDSVKERMLGDALHHLTDIILDNWLSQYSASEMEEMCRLLARCPDGGFAHVRVIEGLDINVDDIVIRYNKLYPEANISMEDPDIG